MFRDLLDNKLTPKPNQKGYSESVSEYLKEYVLFRQKITIDLVWLLKVKI